MSSAWRSPGNAWTPAVRCLPAGSSILTGGVVAAAARGVPRDSVMRRLAHGLFWLTDGLALGALRELAAAGVRVPDDVAVIGFDNIGESRYSVPSLTTVDAGCSSRRSGSSSGSPPGRSRRTRLRKSVFPQGPTRCRSRSPAWFAASLEVHINGQEFSRCESL